MIRDLVICCPSLCFALAFSSMAAEGRWTMLAPLPRAMTEIVATAANGKLYVMAGLQRAGPLGAVDEYDAGADRWTAKRPMPVPAHRALRGPAISAGAVLIDGPERSEEQTSELQSPM